VVAVSFARRDFCRAQVAWNPELNLEGTYFKTETYNNVK